jgi:uncharacterized membrane protein
MYKVLLSMPEYRVKFYCLIGALFFLGIGLGMGFELYPALRTGEFDTMTGSRSQRIQVHLVYREDPLNFLINFIADAVRSLLMTTIGLGLLWRVLKGAKAFGR